MLGKSNFVWKSFFALFALNIFYFQMNNLFLIIEDLFLIDSVITLAALKIFSLLHSFLVSYKISFMKDCTLNVLKFLST